MLRLRPVFPVPLQCFARRLSSQTAPSIWDDSAASAPLTNLFIHGKAVESKSTKLVTQRNPANGEVISRVPNATRAEFDRAIDSCQAAFQSWSQTSIMYRQNLMFKLRQVIEANGEKFSAQITRENGKTISDARAEVFQRSLKCIEHSCGAVPLLMGDHSPSLMKDMDTVTQYEPLGVTAHVFAFNYPLYTCVGSVMPALITGNTTILKPSSVAPGVSMMLAEAIKQAGFPDGVVNVVHGRETVDWICDHPAVKTITFVGGDTMGEHIHKRASVNFKRTQINAGAKNHAVIMPDADRSKVIEHILGGAFGGAGQRCLATSAVILVGKAREWLPDLVKAARQIRVNAPHLAEADMGPVISKEAKQRIHDVIETSIREGATCELDGRGVVVPGYESGYYVGPTIFSNVNVNTTCYKEEVFGPVLGVLEAENLDKALEIINANQYGNGAIIYTLNGAAARKFAHSVKNGMVGINVPIALPFPFMSFTGSRRSFIGQHHTCGDSGLRFFVEPKTIISKWDEKLANSAM